MPLGQLTGVPVLAYHRIVVGGSIPPEARRWGVHESAFRKQLQLVRDLALAVVAPEDVATGQLPARPVVFTFDDGYSSDYQIAFQLLSEFGASATFFVNTSSIGMDGFLTWPWAAEMCRGRMRFGSHAHNHVALTTLNSDRLREELRVSRQMLEERLSTSVEAMAVPYGFCDQRVLDAAWEGGYRIVCTSKPWPAQRGQRVLSRVGVFEHTSFDEFRRLLSNDPTLYLRRWGRERALALPKFVFLRLRPELLGVRTAEDGR